MEAFKLAIWSIFVWTEKFNDKLCIHFSQLPVLKSSRNSSRLINQRCEWTLKTLSVTLGDFPRLVYHNDTKTTGNFTKVPFKKLSVHINYVKSVISMSQDNVRNNTENDYCAKVHPAYLLQLNLNIRNPGYLCLGPCPFWGGSAWSKIPYSLVCLV